MKRLNNKGLTLVEVLAVLVILFIVIAITTNILTSSSKEQIKQVTANDNIKQSSYALKVLTKDFRRMKSYTPSTNTIAIHSSTPVTKFTYKQVNNEIHRIGYSDANVKQSEEVLAKDVETFLICGNELVSTATSCSAVPSTTYYVLIRHTNGQVIQTTITQRGA